MKRVPSVMVGANDVLFEHTHLVSRSAKERTHGEVPEQREAPEEVIHVEWRIRFDKGYTHRDTSVRDLDIMYRFMKSIEISFTMWNSQDGLARFIKWGKEIHTDLR
jgi:hypothetical protein